MKMEFNFKAAGQGRLAIQLSTISLFSILAGCGGSSDTGSSSNASSSSQSTGSYSFFRDQDSEVAEIGGDLQLLIPENSSKKVESVSLYWADFSGNRSGDSWLTISVPDTGEITIPANTSFPNKINAFLVYPINAEGVEGRPNLIKFHDFIGNSLVSGPGGIADSLNNSGDDHPDSGDGLTRNGAWYYGGLSTNDRSKIPAYRSNLGGGTCVYDNGLVAITDMANGRDAYWEANSSNGKANIVNEVDFPAFSFLCDEETPTNLSFEVPRIKDEHGAWSYSAINDAMSYGTFVYDFFLKYLGEPPLDDKIRIRTHYGPEISPTGYETAHWDGAYVNIHGIIDVSKMATLDIIAHEVGHGVLSRISQLKAFDNELSHDAYTLHEAFGDISGVVAKFEFAGKLDWEHGAESRARVRRLNQIKTEATAIESYLDYDDADKNYYLRIGMITYPFYLLTNKWGIDNSYAVVLDAAKGCWTSRSTLPHAAACIEQAAINKGLSESDVEEAFKTVKIKLFDEGVLSHFTSNRNNLTINFSDNSKSTGIVNTWVWDFGDGQNSHLINPTHTYANAGTYKIKLTVSDSTGDSDSFEKEITVGE